MQGAHVDIHRVNHVLRDTRLQLDRRLNRHVELRVLGDIREGGVGERISSGGRSIDFLFRETRVGKGRGLHMRAVE